MTLLLILSLFLPINASDKEKLDEEERAISAEMEEKTVPPIATTPAPTQTKPETVSEVKTVVPQSNVPDIISNIRTAWYANEGRERLVIDLTTGKEPAMYNNRVGDTVSINIETTIDSNKSNHLSKLLQKTHLVNSAQIIALDEEKEVLIQLLVKKNVKEKVITLSNPSRVVIDLQVSKQIKQNLKPKKKV